MFKKLFSILFLATAVFMIAGCEKEEEEKTVKLGVVNWAEGIAMTNLAKVILEDKMDYEVEVTTADVAPIFTSVASGDYDAFMDAWLPLTHASQMEEYGDDLEVLGTNFIGAKIGLVVPEYVTIDSIEEMNANKSKFGSEIVGIDAGAGIMTTTETAIETYDLDFDLTTSSGPMMTAALQAAIEDEEWVVVTGWSPHWKFAEWDLKYLEDPEGVYGDSEVIKTVARVDLDEDMPEVAEFLTNFFMTDQQLGTLMGMIAESNEDPDVVARQWMNDNEDVVNSWLPEE